MLFLTFIEAFSPCRACAQLKCALSVVNKVIIWDFEVLLTWTRLNHKQSPAVVSTFSIGNLTGWKLLIKMIDWFLIFCYVLSSLGWTGKNITTRELLLFFPGLWHSLKLSVFKFFIRFYWFLFLRTGKAYICKRSC